MILAGAILLTFALGGVALAFAISSLMKKQNGNRNEPAK
jgi:hypothetical protein